MVLFVRDHHNLGGSLIKIFLIKSKNIQDNWHRLWILLDVITWFSQPTCVTYGQRNFAFIVKIERKPNKYKKFKTELRFFMGFLCSCWKWEPLRLYMPYAFYYGIAYGKYWATLIPWHAIFLIRSRNRKHEGRIQHNRNTSKGFLCLEEVWILGSVW